MIKMKKYLKCFMSYRSTT